MTQEIIIPKTKENQCRFVDLLDEKDVGRVTYFISHVWASPFSHLIESLEEQLQGEDDTSIFLWIDIFAVNQHGGDAMEYDLSSLGKMVEISKATLVCLDKKGRLLTRIWCLYEIWTTLCCSGGAEQRMKVLAHKIDFESLKQFFIECDVEKAQAFKQSDVDRILGDIQRSTGFQEMNKEIRKAFVESARQEVQQIEKGVDEEKLYDVYLKSGRLLHFTGQYGEAEHLLKKCVDLSERLYGPEDRVTIVSLGELASVLKAEGKYSEAEPLYRRALALDEKKFGNESLDFATSCNNLALLLQDQGKYSEAEPLFRKALEIDEKGFGETAELATSYNNLGVLLQMQGKLSEVEPLYKKSLVIREKVLGAEHPEVAISYNSLAGLFKDQGKYSEAEPFLRKAIAISEKVLGFDHPNVAGAYNNLAILLEAQGKYSEAEPFLQKSLAICVELLGADHPDTGIVLGTMANLFDKQGKIEQAEQYYQRSLEIFENKLGPDHPKTKSIQKMYQNLLQKKQGN